MREFYIQSCGTSSCGIDELSGFESDISKTSKEKALTRQEWMYAIDRAIGSEREAGQLPALILFSGNNYQKMYKFSPQGLAAHLRRIGEDVQVTKEVINPSSGNTIQGFLWSPSRKYREQFKKFMINSSDTSSSS